MNSDCCRFGLQSRNPSKSIAKNWYFRFYESKKVKARRKEERERSSTTPSLNKENEDE